MAKRTVPSKSKLARVARLPRRPDAVLAGGTRPIGVTVREGKELVEPEMTLWLDLATGLVLASSVHSPRKSTEDRRAEALDVLLDAFVKPIFTPPGGDEPLILMPGPGRDLPQITSSPMPDRYLPGTVLVNDAALAEAARELLAPYEVTIEYRSSIPEFDTTFDSLAGMLREGFGGGPQGPFAWDVDAALLPPLYKAAAAYWRLAPWEYMPDHPPLAVALGERGPEPGVESLYASILGGGGSVFGVAFYFSLDAVRAAMAAGAQITASDADIDDTIAMLRQMGAPVDDLPADELHDAVGYLMAELMPDSVKAPHSPPRPAAERLGGSAARNGSEGPPHGPLRNGSEEPLRGTENSLVMFLNTKDESDPTYLAWLTEHALKYPSREAVPYFIRTDGQGNVRSPDEREARALTLALGALNQFFKRFEFKIDDGFEPPARLELAAQVTSEAGAVSVPVAFPPPDYEWSEVDIADWRGEPRLPEPEQPATEAGKTTLYRFKVTLTDHPAVWRRIELRGDQTLHAFHEAIQQAFAWDDDHLYAFFLSGQAWDEDSEYDSPFAEEGPDGEHSAASHRLEHLPLGQGRQFLYIFDFGDEWQHTIKLEQVAPGGVQPGTRYPRIAEVHGDPIPQYGDPDDYDEDNDDLDLE
jgi:hypothetical protein